MCAQPRVVMVTAMRQPIIGRRAVLGAIAAAPFVRIARAAAQQPPLAYPFTLGVASGEPAADGMVLWTRLAPHPHEPHGGMDWQRRTVGWEVAADAGFRTIAGQGEATAWPDLAHSVHVEVAGLQADRPYWYRFHIGDAVSPIGRTRTAPAADARPDRLLFATVGCQSYESGFYTAYRHLSEERVDFVFHYGDYIYENHAGEALDSLRAKLPEVRPGVVDECFSLDDYRARYTLGKLDPDLQAAHAAAPWFVTYDDHEVKNDWVSDVDRYRTPPEIFALRRTAAMQAYYEHMPLRAAAFPRQGVLDIRRRVDWGDLVRAHMLDTRLFRSGPPCGGSWVAPCPDLDSTRLTVLGAAQEHWLDQGLARSPARWNHIAQQVMMMPLDRRLAGNPAVTPIVNTDSWAGYNAARDRLLDRFARVGAGNVVVTTGDEHQNFVGDLQRRGRIVATEFVSTSISSGGDGFDFRPGMERVLADNPVVKFCNDRRGYMLCEVTRDRWTTSFRTVDRVSTPGAPIATRARFAVERGRPGAVPA